MILMIAMTRRTTRHIIHALSCEKPITRSGLVRSLLPEGDGIDTHRCQDKIVAGGGWSPVAARGGQLPSQEAAGPWGYVRPDLPGTPRSGFRLSPAHHHPGATPPG